MRWFVAVLASLFALANLHALPSYPVDEIVIATNTTSGMELSFFVYKSGYSYGNIHGMEKKAALELPYSTSFLAGDVDGDGVDELIGITREAQGFRLDIYRYTAEENLLLRMDVARYGDEGGSWLAGDVDGDGRDELILVRPAVAWTEIHLFTYEPEYSRGKAEKLRQRDVLKYRELLLKWLTGDVNGDGIDEFIAVQESPTGARLSFFLYDASYARDLTQKIRKVGEARHTLLDWQTGDVDGDGVDELIGVEYEYYETRLRVMRYEPGYEYGNVQGLRSLDVLRHYSVEPAVFLGNVEGALRVLSWYPSEEELRVTPGESLRFAAEAEHTDGLRVSYLWRFNGEEVSRGSEFNYSTELGSGVVECIVSAFRSEATLTWQVEVVHPPPKQVREEEERVNTPPEVVIVSPPPGTRVSNVVEVRWRARDEDGDRLTVRVELISARGATVLYEGAEAEGAYALNVLPLEDGSYRLRVEVSDGESTASDEVEFEVYHEEAEVGLLVVASVPRGAVVFVNGERLGVTDAELRLPPGRYRLRLEKAGYMPYETEVEIVRGRSTSVEVRLIKRIFGLSPAVFFFLVLISMSAGVVLLYRLGGAVREYLRAPREELE